MFASGYLSDSSLPELFQCIQDGKENGLLSIQGLVLPGQAQPRYYFIWFDRGRIVTVSNRLDSRGLATLISDRFHVSTTMTERLIRRCPPDEPLGRFLRSQRLLTTRQLEILFVAQVIHQICQLFEVPDGYFVFDRKAPLPNVEMTGLSVMATEVILPGLRILKNWGVLRDKLPHPQSALVSLLRGQPNMRINHVEWSVWRLIDDKTSLHQIALHLSLSIEEVQRIAFRLIVVGLAEEVPMMLTEPTLKDVPVMLTESTVDVSKAIFPIDIPDGETLSPSFFRNLIGFLQQMPKSS